MKPLRSFVIVLILAFAFVLSGNSCGPFFAEAVFVTPYGPDGPYANYAKGQLGVPQPTYRLRHLVIAYDWLNGTGLTAGEQQQAVQLNDFYNSPAYSSDEAKQKPGLAAWTAARKDSGVPVPPEQKPGPGEYMSQGLDGDHAVPGASYEYFANCLDPAFSTAAQTLRDRKAAHATDAASFADWVRGQDAVFANCNGIANAMPADAPTNSPSWLRQDRAYQQAAAVFYQTDYDAAITRLKAITAEKASPWHTIAPLVSARAMIRRATVGQITELPAEAVEVPNTNYSEARAAAQRKYADLLKQNLPQRLAEARTALQAIIADPALAADHADASGLLDFVLLRLDPEQQAQTLATRLSAPNRPQTPGAFQQALTDLYYLLKKPAPVSEMESPVEQQAAAKVDLIAWIETMQHTSSVDANGLSPERPSDIAAMQTEHVSAAKRAASTWQTTHAAPWLIAVLTATRTGQSATPELLHAAGQVAKDSPAWTAATYYRLHSAANVPATRTDIAALLPTLQGHASRSTINLFKILQQTSSPTLDAFLSNAGALPAGITLDTDDADPPNTKPDPQGLCGVNTSQAETLLFDRDTATVLNTRMPLSLLADAASSTTLPHNLSFQIAQSTWTRALLLDQPAVAKRMSPLLIGCYPAWKPWLDAYDSAASEDDRRITGLLALMRFASTEPLVRVGIEREGGFATYSEFRDNWWQASGSAEPPPSANKSDIYQATFFGTTPATPAELPDPPFLTPSDRTSAEIEVAALRKVPCASDYFAQAALDWQKQHPTDARTITALGFAERVVRNGCRTDATSALNRQLFTLVQTKYPTSEWARKYTSWE